MAGETKQLTFAEGVTVTAPAQVNLVATSIPSFASDAAFEASKGSSGTVGDIYQNTTDGLIHHHDGTSWKSVDNVKVNLTATTDPGINDDDTAGYGVGSKWVNTTNDTVFFAVDVTTGAAIWKTMVDVESTQTLSGSKTFSSAVTISDATSSTTKDTGSLVTEGGIGVEENLNVGGNANVGGNVVVTGNLTVNGTTTTLNTTTLDVEDVNITVNNGGNQASADGNAGLNVEMSDATDVDLLYDSTLTSKWKAGEAGAEQELATTGHSQTLTNKSLQDTNNKFVNTADSSKTLDVDLSGNTANADTTLAFQSSADDTFNFPDLSGGSTTLLTTDQSQVVTNKDIDGGTASDTNRLTLHKDTRANLELLTRKQGNIFYDTTNTTIVIDTGAALTEVAGSSAFASGITTDTVDEFTPAAGVTVDGVLLKDSEVSTDTVNELTPAAGVTIDGVLLKDSQVSTDVINELTPAAGVTIDGIQLKDSIVYTDTINEKTLNNGVTIDSVNLKDNAITCNAINIGASVTVTGTLDEDNMASDSAVKICTQQSIKAYTDAQRDIQVVAIYERSTAQGMTNNSFDIVNYDTTVKDNFSAVTTGAGWFFTAPRDDDYMIFANVGFASFSQSAGNEYFLAIYLDTGGGAAVEVILDHKYIDSSYTNLIAIQGSHSIPLSSGDKIDIRCYQASGSNRNLIANATYNRVAIISV